MKQDSASDEVDGRATQQQHELGEEHHPHKTDVLFTYARIDHGLRKEGEDQLKQTAKQQSKDELRKIAFVFHKVARKKLQLVALYRCLSLVFIKESGRFHQQSHAFVLSFSTGTNPVIAELFTSIGNQPFPRVGHKHILSPYLINHYEVILVPMDDAG